MSATKGYGNTSTVNGQGATYDICVSAQQDEVDPAVDYISAADSSGSEFNAVDLKQNESDEYARLTLDGKLVAKILIYITRKIYYINL